MSDNPYLAQLAEYESDPRGGWRIPAEEKWYYAPLIKAWTQQGECYMSEEGRQTLLAIARVWEQHREALTVLQRAYGELRCPHGVPFRELEWQSNDYCYDPLSEPERAVFDLNGGFHASPEAIGGYDYCIVAWYRAVGSKAGLFELDDAVQTG